MKSQQRKKIKLVLVRSDFMAINHWLQTGAVYTVGPYQPPSLWMKSVSNQGVIVNLEHADTDLEDLKTERGCLKEEPQIVLDDFVILNHVDHSNEVVRIFKKRMGRAGGRGIVSLIVCNQIVTQTCTCIFYNIQSESQSPLLSSKGLAFVGISNEKNEVTSSIW